MYELFSVSMHLFPRFIATLKRMCLYVTLINYLKPKRSISFSLSSVGFNRKRNFKILQSLITLYGRSTSIFLIELYFICNLTREEIYDFIILNLML